MTYTVTAPMVVVSVPIGARTSQVRFLERGSLLPEGVDEASLNHLLGMGMVAEQAAEPDPEPDIEPESDPDAPAPEALTVESMTVEQLKAHLTGQGIPFDGVALKADLLALAQQ